MAAHFKCGSQVHAQTHTRKPQTHLCQRGERPVTGGYRETEMTVKDGGAQPSAALLRSARRWPALCSPALCLPALSLSLDPSQLFSVDLVSAVVSNER